MVCGDGGAFLNAWWQRQKWNLKGQTKCLKLESLRLPSLQQIFLSVLTSGK
jgi:hypothetical protein